MIDDSIRPTDDSNNPKYYNLITFKLSSFNSDDKQLILARLIQLGFNFVSRESDIVSMSWNTRRYTIDIIPHDKSGLIYIYINKKLEFKVDCFGKIKFLRFNKNSLKKLLE